MAEVAEGNNLNISSNINTSVNNNNNNASNANSNNTNNAQGNSNGGVFNFIWNVIARDNNSVKHTTPTQTRKSRSMLLIILHILACR